MRDLALLSTIAIMSGCASEPVTARIESISGSNASIDVTLSVSDRLEDMLSGQDFFSRGGVFLEDSRSGLQVLPAQTVQVQDEPGRALFTAHFRCPLIGAVLSDGMVGRVVSEEVASPADYELVVSWNAHMLIGSQGTIRMSVPNDIACEVAEGAR